MPVNFYTLNNANGNLKLVAELEEFDASRPDIALDALLEDHPKFAGTEFIALDPESFVKVEAEDNLIIQPRRAIRVTGIDFEDEDDEDEDQEDEEPVKPVKKAGKKKPDPEPEPDEEDEDETDDDDDDLEVDDDDLEDDDDDETVE